MKSAQFEKNILKTVESSLSWGGQAEFSNGTLFVTGIMPDEAEGILLELIRNQPGKIRMNKMGSYQTDYTFTYDFV